MRYMPASRDRGRIYDGLWDKVVRVRLERRANASESLEFSPLGGNSRGLRSSQGCGLELLGPVLVSVQVFRSQGWGLLEKGLRGAYNLAKEGIFVFVKQANIFSLTHFLWCATPYLKTGPHVTLSESQPPAGLELQMPNLLPGKLSSGLFRPSSPPATAHIALSAWMWFLLPSLYIAPQ